MDNAINFFSNSAIEQVKCTHLQKDHVKALEWETNIVSVFSPGIVKDEETLIRTLFVPLHIDTDTGELKPSAFDDAMNKGLSVNRESLTSIEKIQTNAIEHAAVVSQTRSARDYYGYSTAKTSEIRAHEAYELRIFSVYDTSLDEEDGKSHADVCAIISKDAHEDLTEKGCKKLIRGRLHNCFSNIVAAPDEEVS